MLFHLYNTEIAPLFGITRYSKKMAWKPRWNCECRSLIYIFEDAPFLHLIKVCDIQVPFNSVFLCAGADRWFWSGKGAMFSHAGVWTTHLKFQCSNTSSCVMSSHPSFPCCRDGKFRFRVPTWVLRTFWVLELIMSSHPSFRCRDGKFRFRVPTWVLRTFWVLEFIMSSHPSFPCCRDGKFRFRVPTWVLRTFWVLELTMLQRQDTQMETQIYMGGFQNLHMTMV